MAVAIEAVVDAVVVAEVAVRDLAAAAEEAVALALAGVVAAVPTHALAVVVVLAMTPHKTEALEETAVQTATGLVAATDEVTTAGPKIVTVVAVTVVTVNEDDRANLLDLDRDPHNAAHVRLQSTTRITVNRGVLLT